MLKRLVRTLMVPTSVHVTRDIPGMGKNVVVSEALYNGKKSNNSEQINKSKKLHLFLTLMVPQSHHLH